MDSRQWAVTAGEKLRVTSGELQGTAGRMVNGKLLMVNEQPNNKYSIRKMSSRELYLYNNRIFGKKLKEVKGFGVIFLASILL